MELTNQGNGVVCQKYFYFVSHLLPATWNSPQQRRQFLENYAKQNLFDPLIPYNWYLHKTRLQSERVCKFILRNVFKLIIQGINLVILHHSSSVSKALVDLFPEIGFDKSKLKANGILHSQV